MGVRPRATMEDCKDVPPMGDHDVAAVVRASTLRRTCSTSRRSSSTSRGTWWTSSTVQGALDGARLGRWSRVGSRREGRSDTAKIARVGLLPGYRRGGCVSMYDL